jgi:hypothetical protein
MPKIEGRHSSEMAVDAINRNGWTPSIGFVGHHHSVRRNDQSHLRLLAFLTLHQAEFFRVEGRQID